MKMQLEHPSDEERLKEMGLFSLKIQGFWRNLISVYLHGGKEKKSQTLLSGAQWKDKSNGHKSNYREMVP